MYLRIYKTCRFSQLLDLESLAQTLPSNPLTFKLADVLLPRYFLGLLCAERIASGNWDNDVLTGELGLVPP